MSPSPLIAHRAKFGPHGSIGHDDQSFLPHLSIRHPSHCSHKIESRSSDDEELHAENCPEELLCGGVSKVTVLVAFVKQVSGRK